MESDTPQAQAPGGAGGPDTPSTGTPPQGAPHEPGPAALGPHDFPVVGIGASAGGLRALQRFFASVPEQSGMAFVVILHLSPEYESSMAPLLQKASVLPVTQVAEAMTIAPDRVYVIPPTRHLLMVDGTIQIQERSSGPESRAPIDLFFRTLAETHGRSAAAVVLSGNGVDGTMGIKRVKEHGGVAIVQDPQEAEYESMPRSAIATGLVDFVLPVESMYQQLHSYWDNGKSVRLPPPEPTRRDEESDLLREIFGLMRSRTGHDFSQYKRPTLLRRIGRRMQVNSVGDLAAYVAVLWTNPEEVQALLRDLLISVTNFFRDQDAWEALEGVVPQIFAGKDADEQVRAWVAGCATGEEAYSVAMLLYEYADSLDHPPRIQIFATDIDEDAIAVARHGLYPETIAADVSPQRLARFFTSEQGQYRIKKDIRDLVLFAVHNVLRDPPFSRLDVITCRNLLIYLNRDVQEQVLQLFHFTLRPNGCLLLGSSESTDGVPGLFTPVDKAQRLFQRRPVPLAAPAAVPGLPLIGPARRQPALGRAPADGAAHSLAELHQQILAQYAPPSVVVNEDYDIVHLSRGVGRLLSFAEGEPSHNLLKVVHPSLRIELRTALFTAAQHGRRAETRRVRIELDGEARLVTTVVQPIDEPEWARGYFAVIFHESADVSDMEPSVTSGAEPVMQKMEEELQRTKEQLRTTIEQYETAVEEYKAANEELQAINEELRAATEELETSKEELQSVNEELTTVNQELKHKIDEVSQSNNDLQNLMASTEIGTIFVDRELRIKRYTPATQQVFNLIPSDVNRPLLHLTHALEYDELAQDASRVLETLTVVTREVRSASGRWYFARLLPYRTVEDKIDGVILTFVDITERKQAEEAMRESEHHLRFLVESVQDSAIVMLSADGRFDSWNSGAERMFGYSGAEVIGRDIGLIYAPEDQDAGIPGANLAAARDTGRIEESRWYARKDGARFYGSSVLIPVVNAALRGFVLVTRDLTAQEEAEDAIRRASEELERLKAESSAALERATADHTAMEQALRASERRLTEILQQLPFGLLVADREGRIVFGNRRAEQLLQVQDAEDYRALRPFSPDRQPYEIDGLPLARALLRGASVSGEEIWFPRPDGGWLRCRVTAAPFHDEGGQITGAAIAIEESGPQPASQAG